MTNRVTPTPYFISRAKRLMKKFATLEMSLLRLEQELLRNPTLGVSYGSNIYKVRLADVSKGKGKSGGFRIVTYLVKEDVHSVEIFLITIFDKSEEATIKKEQVKKLVQSLGL